MNISQGNHAQSDDAWKKAREKALKILPVAIFILVAFFFAKYFDTAWIKGFLEENGPLGIIICLFAFVGLNLTFIPSDPITLLLIAWKGPFAAIVLSTIGDTLSAVVEYYIGDKISDMADFEKKKEKLPFYLNRLPMNSPVFLILARLLPGYGPKFVSIAAGIYQVPMSTNLWTSLVANLIGAIIEVFGGYGLIKLFK